MVVKRLVKRSFVPLAAAFAATVLTFSPQTAGAASPAGLSGPGSTSDVSELRPPDPHKELRHLSKNLKLNRTQRVGVDTIFQERTREIRLLHDIESLSDEYRTTLATKVMEDSNAEIETLLRRKQKKKFAQVLAKDHETQ